MNIKTIKTKKINYMKVIVPVEINLTKREIDILGEIGENRYNNKFGYLEKEQLFRLSMFNLIKFQTIGNILTQNGRKLVHAIKQVGTKIPINLINNQNQEINHFN